MSLSHAILGLLGYQPMSGYDLKHRWFDRSMQYFWPADQAQIYRTLDKLVDDGLATYTIVAGGDRPNRKVYALTPAGEVALDRWLISPEPLPVTRDPLLIQLFCGERAPTAELVHLVRRSQADHRARLAAYEAIAAQLPQWGTGKRLVLWQLVLSNGIHRERGYLDWADEALATLATIAETTEDVPGDAANGATGDPTGDPARSPGVDAVER